MRTGSRWVRSLAGALTLFVGLALVAPPVRAGDAAATLKQRPTTLRAATEAKVANLNLSPRVDLSPEGDSASSSTSKPFFKTTKGVMALVLLAGGVTWAAVSRSKDAVHSPAR